MRPSADRRTMALSVVALATGLAIGYLDSSPGWDDTGITAGLLALAAAFVAAADGGRPWLWAALVGLPLVIIEVPQTGSAAPIAALLFAAVGASIGLVGRRALGVGQPTS